MLSASRRPGQARHGCDLRSFRHRGTPRARRRGVTAPKPEAFVAVDGGLDPQLAVDRIGILVNLVGVRVVLAHDLVRCLMPFAYCRQGKFPTLMQRSLGGCAERFNRRHIREVHLFENRFRSTLVEVHTAH